MKLFETHFEEYIKEVTRFNLHKDLKKIYDKFPSSIEDMSNIIFYGPAGVGKYSQMLYSIQKYSPTELRYEKKMCINYLDKSQYFLKISDIHYEVDMSILGCNAKTLWNCIYYQIMDSITTKQIKTDVSSTFKGKYEKYKKMFNDFIVYHEDMIEEINSKIQSHDGDIYLFGAHIFSQYLISFGLSTEKVICILDNSPIKIGKRLYGTNLKVNSPKILSDSSNPLVILKAGVYNEEIKTGILTNINSKTKFI